MGTPAERLRKAREACGLGDAAAGAAALGLPYPTYAAHENGTRNYTKASAALYARKFKTTPEWLLYGRGSSQPNVDDLEAMLRIALSEVTFETKLGDLPRIVAPNLHEQIERFRADRESAAPLASKTGRRKGDQSRHPTKPA